MEKVVVFLGGTCNESTWRNELIPLLKIDYFNPVVEDWTPECIERENEYKENCDICLFVITPFMQGCYSIAEAVDVSNKHPEKVVFVHLNKTITKNEIRKFTKEMQHSLEVTGELIERNGGKYFTSLDEVIDYISYFINFNHFNIDYWFITNVICTCN